MNTTKPDTELYGHQVIARKAISLAKIANPHLDTTPFLSLDERKELHGEAVRLLHSSVILVNWTSIAAQHAKPASADDKRIAERCIDWMIGAHEFQAAA
tara:strand:+ start:4993 stop:5289 length:297 start_codon:yes stop_codon:yes gene_type:complete